MRCAACDCLLSDDESTRKSRVTGEYLDLCDHCIEPIDELQYATYRPADEELTEEDVEDEHV